MSGQPVPHEPGPRPTAEPTMKLTGAQALIKSLEMEGVEVMFGLPGGAILPVYDPLIDSSIRHILVRHEQGAGHMAEGYAHATGRPGVAMVTSGPAATNIVTPLVRRVHGLDPARRDHRPGAVRGDRHRRVPGVRHRRHHDAGHQAQLARHRRPGHPAHHPRGVPRRDDRAGPARCSSTSRRTSPNQTMDWYWPETRRPARLQAQHRRATRSRSRTRRASSARRSRPVIYAGGGILKARRGRGAARARRAHRHPRRHHADGPRRVPRRPPAVPRHAGHARQLHRGHRDAEGRPAHRARARASTTGSPARSARSRPTPRSSTSTSTPPSSARCAGPTCRSSATAAS